MSDSEADLSPVENDLEIVEENENVVQAVQSNEREEATENQEDPAEADKKEVKVKRVRNPQPKLNEERLKGPRGLQMLGKIFEDIKFKGRGHEEENLCVLMKNYEYWCHRLFPKFPFDECLERMERLGSKKILQTYIKRIRMDLLLDDDIVVEGQQEAVVVNNDVENNEVHVRDRFDDLLSQQARTQPQPTNQHSNVLSDEQLERIRINRERAQRLRKQMLIQNKVNTGSFSQSGNQSSQIGVEDNIISVASPSSNICNSTSDINFTEDMSVDDENSTNHGSSQNSIEGESICFQTTAVVHNSNKRLEHKEISNQEDM